LPFALIPLARFTSDRRLMGVLVNRRPTTVLTAAVTGLIIGLNGYLLYRTLVAG